MIREVASALRGEAVVVDERRLLVLHGERAATIDAARTVLDEAGLLSPAGRGNVVFVSDQDSLPVTRIPPRRSEELLGTTQDAVVYDAHAECRPNALGRVTGAVDGGGLLVLCTPNLDDWPTDRDGFDDGLAVPPFEITEVGGTFRTRLVSLLRAHPGIAIVDVDRGVVEDDGLTHPGPRLATSRDARAASGSAARRQRVPDSPRFPRAAYTSCLTDDQADAVAACEVLAGGPSAVVLEADRGRGKSSAVGLAAASLAQSGADVMVTAPGYRSAAEVFERATVLLDDLDALESVHDDGHEIRSRHGGRLTYAAPPDAVERVQGPGPPDVVVVDEAAAIPVRLLVDLLDCDRLAFATTVHGYEGAGRGFDVRFRGHLDDARHDVTTVTLDDPIRYAAGDPIEVWSFRALALDARPAVDPLVEAAMPETTTYTALPPADLLADDHLLRESFGLLVYAHYRTEPNDLARLLDAPNLIARALMHDGHVAAVALLAREGGLDEATRAAMYEGGRVKGNMLPDVLTSQLRDEDAAVPVGYRVMRIATHPVCRNRGLGSRLLSEIRDEFADAVDWLGVGYGATPELVDFWDQNDYSTVHVSTTRNQTSGEYSAIMLNPTSHLGDQLHSRHADWFVRRIPGVLQDALSDLDPDVTRACLHASDSNAEIDLSADEWKLVAACAYGPAMYAVDPAPFARLVTHHLTNGDPDLLDADAERLLVSAALQHRPWQEIVEDLAFHSRGSALRAFGRALQPLVDEYGTTVAHEEASRHRN